MTPLFDLAPWKGWRRGQGLGATGGTDSRLAISCHPGEGILPVWQGVLNSTGGNILLCGFRPECDQRTGRRQTKIVREEEKKNTLPKKARGRGKRGNFSEPPLFPELCPDADPHCLHRQPFRRRLAAWKAVLSSTHGRMHDGGERKVIFGFIFPSTRNFFFLV